ESYTGKTFTNKWRSAGFTDPTKRKIARTKPTSGKKWHKVEPVPRPLWSELGDTATEQIIEPSVFAAVQGMVSERTLKGARHRNEKNPYLLRGLIYCSCCKRSLNPRHHEVQANGQPRRHKYYRCRKQDRFSGEGRCDGKMVVADWIEGEAWNALAEILMEPGRLEVAIEAMADDQIAGQAMAGLTQIEKQLADARESQEILYAEYVRALKGKQNTLAERLNSDWMLAEATVAQFEQTAKDYKNRIEARTDTKALAERFRQRLDRLPA